MTGGGADDLQVDPQWFRPDDRLEVAALQVAELDRPGPGRRQIDSLILFEGQHFDVVGDDAERPSQIRPKLQDVTFVSCSHGQIFFLVGRVDHPRDDNHQKGDADDDGESRQSDFLVHFLLLLEFQTDGEEDGPDGQQAAEDAEMTRPLAVGQADEADRSHDQRTDLKELDDHIHLLNDHRVDDKN